MTCDPVHDQGLTENDIIIDDQWNSIEIFRTFPNKLETIVPTIIQFASRCAHTKKQ